MDEYVSKPVKVKASKITKEMLVPLVGDSGESLLEFHSGMGLRNKEPQFIREGDWLVEFSNGFRKIYSEAVFQRKFDHV